MARLMSTARLDLTIQLRNRLYHISVALALLLGLGARQFLDPGSIATLLPLFVLGVGGTALMYVAALIVFERDEHTLDMLSVSPLRLWEYLASKVGTLTLLCLVEGVTIALAAQGLAGLNWPLLLAGVALLGAISALCGAILVVRYATITDFLVPAAVVMIPLELPIVYFLGFSDSPLWLLSPTSGPTMLIWGAWRDLAPWQLAYGFGYSLLMLAVGFRWALGALRKFLVKNERS